VGSDSERRDGSDEEPSSPSEPPSDEERAPEPSDEEPASPSKPPSDEERAPEPSDEEPASPSEPPSDEERAPEPSDEEPASPSEPPSDEERAPEPSDEEPASEASDEEPAPKPKKKRRKKRPKKPPTDAEGAARPKKKRKKKRKRPRADDDADTDERDEGDQEDGDEAPKRRIPWLAIILVIAAVELFLFGSRGRIEVCVAKEGVHDFALLGTPRTEDNTARYPSCETRWNIGMKSNYDELKTDAVVNACRRANIFRGKEAILTCAVEADGWKHRISADFVMPWAPQYRKRLFWFLE